MGTYVLKFAGRSEVRLIALLMLAAGTLSAFMNNVGATAVFLPVAIGISRQTRIPVSRFLMPISFASLMGGNITLIGTPPNILAADILRQSTGQTFAFFDFTPMGILILLFGIIYMALIGRHLLPSHPEADLAESYSAREYLSEIRVLPNSLLAGKTMIESRFGEAYDLNIVGLTRNRETFLTIRRNDKIQVNDILLVKGRPDKLLAMRNNQGLQIEPDLKHTQEADLKSNDAMIAEAVLMTNSTLAGQSLKDIRFREKFRLTVLALWRHGHYVDKPLSEEPLRPGDVLLVQGRRDFVNILRTSPDFLVLEPVPLEKRRTAKAPLALAIFAGLLAVVIMEWLPIAIAGVIAAMLMVLLGVLNVEETYQAIDWRSIFLIGGMLPLGLAMESTGAAKFLADTVVTNLSGYGPMTILLGLYVLAALLTQSLSNAAAIVLIGPIAINIARGLGVDPRSFMMAMVIAVSNDYLTPIGHQSNTLVFGPGGYKFSDYTRVGLGLSLTYFTLVAVALPIFWPLFP
jgi:di/tricarboxylate transporter